MITEEDSVYKFTFTYTYILILYVICYVLYIYIYILLLTFLCFIQCIPVFLAVYSVTGGIWRELARELNQSLTHTNTVVDVRNTIDR